MVVVRWITLSTRPERTKHFESHTVPTLTSLACPIICHVQEPREHGTFWAHLEVWEAALRDGDDETLIFEDDATPTNLWSQELFDEVMRQAALLDWDALYLGNCPTPDGCLGFTAPVVSPNLIRDAPLCLHAYVLRPEGRRRLLDDLGVSGPRRPGDLDVRFSALLQGRCLASIPNLYLQAPLGSDGGWEIFFSGYQATRQQLKVDWLLTIFPTLTWIVVSYPLLTQTLLVLLFLGVFGWSTQRRTPFLLYLALILAASLVLSSKKTDRRGSRLFWWCNILLLSTFRFFHPAELVFLYILSLSVTSLSFVYKACQKREEFVVFPSINVLLSRPFCTIDLLVNALILYGVIVFVGQHLGS